MDSELKDIRAKGEMDSELKDIRAKGELVLARIKEHLDQRYSMLNQARIAKEKAKASMELLGSGVFGFNQTKHDKERLSIAVRTYSQTLCLENRIITTIQRLETQRDTTLIKMRINPESIKARLYPEKQTES